MVRFRTARLALVALLGVFALSGCLRFTTTLTVSPNNTVSGEYVVAVVTGSGAQLGMTDRELAEELWKDSNLSTALSKPTVDTYRADGYSGIVVRFTDEPLATFSPARTPVGITRVGDEFVVSGEISGGTGTGGTSDADTDDAGTDHAGTGATAPDVHVTLTFPGNVTSSNGTVTGRTVSWTVTEEGAVLSARASAVPVTDHAAQFAYFVATVIAVAAVAYWLAGVIGRRRYPHYVRS